MFFTHTLRCTENGLKIKASLIWTDQQKIQILTENFLNTWYAKFSALGANFRPLKTPKAANKTCEETPKNYFQPFVRFKGDMLM